MSELDTISNDRTWLRSTGIVVVGVIIWQVGWILAGFFFTAGKEFADDAPTYRYYVDDPTMLFSDRHQKVFGAAVAPPLLPFELKAFHSLFAPLGDFLAFRLTMLVYILSAYAVGFGVAFFLFGTPNSRAAWIQAVLIAAVPVGWVTVLTSQDDSVATTWSAFSLAAYVMIGPIAATIAAGVGVFCGKILLALAFLGFWIACPGRRLAITVVGSIVMATLVSLLIWRDAGIGSYTAYVYPPYMGASPFGILSLLGVEYDLYMARNISAVFTVFGLAAFTWIGTRRRLSSISAITGLHALFLVTYFGAMPDYYVWFLPFLIATLWACCRRGLWGTLLVGWFSSFFAYGYKVIYGMNSHIHGNKPALKAWAADNIPFDISVLQIPVALAAVACTLLFAIGVLLRDPCGGQVRGDESIQSK